MQVQTNPKEISPAAHQAFFHAPARLGLLALALILLGPSVYGDSIKDSSHDLSTTSSPEICIFCHTPHNANQAAGSPLWNRSIKDDHFTMYSSDTMNSPLPGKPGAQSLLCLGCHDGVLSSIDVNGNLVSTKHDLVNYHGTPDTSSSPSCRSCHGQMYGDGPFAALGTNLGNDHPISMDYPTAVVDPGFNVPPDATTGWGEDTVMLFNGKVECSSCHEVHDPGIYPFLRSSNNDAALCLTCHDK